MDCRERCSHARGAYYERGRSRHKSNSERVVRNMEGRNVGTKGKNPKQDLTSAKNLTIELPEGHESPYHSLD